MKLFSTFINHPTERYRSSHSSTICELKNGDFFSVWFSGTIEGAPDTVILGSRFSILDRTWSDPQTLVDVPDHASGNPRIFAGPRGELWLLFAVNYGRWCHGGSRLFLKRSFDDGCSWSDMSIFWDQWGILGKNKPLHLRSQPAVWLIPVEWEDECVSAFFRSDDYGATWSLTDGIGSRAGVRVEQPTIVELGVGLATGEKTGEKTGEETSLADDGSPGNIDASTNKRPPIPPAKSGSLAPLMAYMRSCEGNIYRTSSNDAGKTWSEPEPTSLPNNDSGIDMVMLRSGILLLAHNPVAMGENGTRIVDQKLKQRPEFMFSQSEFSKNKNFYRSTIADIEAVFPRRGPRTPLTVSCSLDNGKHWQPWLELENGTGEFSYPAIIESSNGDVHLSYTYNRAYIKHVIIPREIIMDRAQKKD
jgi:predicted neuraminidase